MNYYVNSIYKLPIIALISFNFTIFIPLIFISSTTCSDKACICLDDVPLAIIIKSAIDDLPSKSIDTMSSALLESNFFMILFAI